MGVSVLRALACLFPLPTIAQRKSLRSRATLASSAPSPRWPHASIRRKLPRSDNEKYQCECFAIAASKLNTLESDFDFFEHFLFSEVNLGAVLVT